MSSSESDRSAAGLAALPTVEQLRRAGDGYDEQGVREAFDAFRRHTAQLQAQLRVLQAARTSSNLSPTGHAVRMDALHLIRAAAEFADTLERDAQTASATQVRRTEEEVSAKQKVLQEREAEIERYRTESERQRSEILNAAKAEARDLARQVERRRHARVARSRDPRHPAARAVAPSGDRAHELRPRRGRADAGVGASAGDRRHGSCPQGRRAVARGCGSRRAGDQPGRAVDHRRRTTTRSHAPAERRLRAPLTRLSHRPRRRRSQRHPSRSPSLNLRLTTPSIGPSPSLPRRRTRLTTWMPPGPRRKPRLLRPLPPSRRPMPPTLGRPSRPMTGSPSPSGSHAHARSTLAATRARSVLPDRRRHRRRPARSVGRGDLRRHRGGICGHGPLEWTTFRVRSAPKPAAEPAARRLRSKRPASSP